MVEIKQKFFCIYGNDFNQRRIAVENIKKRILPNKENSLNVFTIYGAEAQIKDFQEKILTKSFGGTKLVIIKNADELSPQIKKFIIADFQRIAGLAYVIFEIEKDYSRLLNKKNPADNFFPFIFKKSSVIRASCFIRDYAIEDFAASLRKGDFISSSYIAQKLFSKSNSKELGPQLLGVIGSVFFYMKNPAKKEKYLDYLFEADRFIKQKGLDGLLVIQRLLAKISQD